MTAFQRELFECVSIADAALDVRAMAFEDPHSVFGYVQTRDMSLVREVPGSKLTRFFLHDIPSSVFWQYVCEAPDGSPLRYFRAFQFGVARIQHAKLNDGRTVELMVPEEVSPHPDRPRFFSEKDMARLAPAYVREIGEVAYMRTFFGGAPPGSWQVPPTLFSVLAHRYSQFADEIQNMLGASNDKPSVHEAL